MPRERDPNRERAFELWRHSHGQLDLVEIASQLAISPGTVRGWKSKDNWDARMNGTLQSEERNAPKDTERSKRGGAPSGNQHAKGHGAPKGNQNAKGNRGGHGGPPGNDKAVTHGFFRRIFPDDEETQAIIEEIGVKSPLDILWENIVIQYTAIARAQKIMFVKDQDDMTKEIKKTETYSDDNMTSEKQEWEIQFAWDKQATFLQAQSRAISTLEGLLARYEDMLALDLKNEKQRLELAKMRAEIAKLKGDEDPVEDDGFIEALKGKAAEVWGDGEVET
jgi:uncharacterized protein YjcR